MLRRSPALLSVCVALASALPAPAAAAPVLRHQLTVNGDFALFGNTIAHDCAAGVAPLVGTVGACGTNTADSGVDVSWRSNPGAGTAAANNTITVAQSQSTSVLTTARLPAGATVRYARLYWGAQSSGTGFDAGAQVVTPDGGTHAITADQGLVINPAAGAYWYQSSADVTSILQALAEPRGAYTVSGVDTRTLVNLNSNTTFVAWWVVVFYEDPADTALRQLTLFDGLDYVDGANPASVTLGGFLVPSGGFDAKLGVVTYEGDSNILGDQLLFKGYKSTGPAPTVLTVLTDALNPADNFFNGTRGWLGVAQSNAGDLPRMSGGAASMMSFDFDVVDLKALAAIAPGDDSALISATSTGDVYALGAFVTSINTLKPSFIDTVKTAANLTRAEGVFAGDVIEYTIDTVNTGNDPSILTVLEDALPAGVTYVPGTLQIVSGANAGAKTDATGDDQGEYDAAARRVTVRLGAGATAAVGGTMAIGETAQLKFRVQIDAGASGILENQAVVVAAGLSGEPARQFQSRPPLGTGPTVVPVDQCLDDTHCGGATPACMTSATPNVCVGCTDGSYCGGATPVCDLAVHACVGLTTVSPAAQAKTTVPGTAAPFPMTLTSNLAGADTYDLDVADPGCGWGVELRTSGGTLLGTRDGAGVWTIAPGGDTNGNGLPDLGPTPGGGGTSQFTLWLAPPGATPVGASCAATLGATGASGGLVASATATLRTGAAATYTPDHTGAGAKPVPRGGDVGFPGIVQNNGSAGLAFALAATVTATPAAGALAAPIFYSDPNGDGDPADGAPITSTGLLAAYGGTVRVVLVVRASTATGTPLATGTILDVVATATAGAVVATQTSRARVQYAATYADAARTLVEARFAPCDTVYLGASLLPSGFPFALEWYAKASPLRGVDVPVRAVDPWAVSGGAGSDQLLLPADALGTWTVLVVRKAAPDTVIDTITFEVERAGAFVSLAVASRIGAGDGLSVAASVRNDNASSTFRNSRLAYAVTDGTAYMDGTGAFGATPATAHLTSALDVGAGATAADGWAIGSPAWPAPGLYRVDAEWRLECGATPVIALATASFEVVPAPPAITSPADGALLGTSTPAISGTASPGAAVTVTVGAATCGPVVAAGDGSWTCTFAAPLGDGPHVATAVQVVGGATSDPSAPIGFTVDTTAPAAPVLASLASPTSAASVTVTGTAEAGSAVTIYKDGVAAGTVTAAGDGSFSLAVAVAEGLRSFTATATDAIGNVSPPSNTVTVLVDRTAPLAPVLDTLTSPTNAASVTVTGTAEAGSTVTIYKDGVAAGTVTAAGGTFSLAVPVTEGLRAFTATAADAAGNVSPQSNTVTVLVDRTAPGLATVDVPADGALLGAADAPGGLVSFAGTSELASTVEVEVDGFVIGIADASSGAWTASQALLDGSHQVRVRATDAAGNTGSWSGFNVFTLDVAAPAAPVLDQPATPTNAASVTVTGTAEAGSTVTIYKDGVAAGTVTAAGGTFSLVVPVTDGLRSFTATSADAAGNVSPQSNTVTVLVDRTAPAAPVLDQPATPTGATTVTVTGTAEAGAAVTISLDGSPAGTVTAVGGTFSLAVPVTEGLRSFTATAADAAGNVSPQSNTVNVLVDFSLPAPPVLASLTSPTAATSVTVTGTAEAGNTVRIFRDTVLVGTVTAAADGSFSLAVAVGEGLRSFTATATDAAGNVSPPSNTVTVLVDRTAPAAPVLDQPATPTGATTVTVTGTAEAGAAVTISLDGSPAGTVTAAADGTFSLAVAVAEGLRSFTATAADAAGNVSPQSNTVTVLVDRSLPAAPVLDPIESPTSDTTITVTGTAEPGATVAILVDGVQVATVVAAADGTFAAPLVLVEGSQVITATASNAAGTSPESAARTVVVDLTAPAAPIITAPSAGEALPAGTVLIEGSAEPGATVSVVVNGETLTAVAAADGSFSVSAVLPEGAWTATATATDAAENVSPQADRSFTTVADGSGGGVHVSGGGGCGCSPAGGASPAGLLLLPLALGLAPRRRRRAA